MTLVLHRTIHPVGQGAFYSEVFEDDGNVKFTMVYFLNILERKKVLICFLFLIFIKITSVD